MEDTFSFAHPSSTFLFWTAKKPPSDFSDRGSVQITLFLIANFRKFQKSKLQIAQNLHFFLFSCLMSYAFSPPKQKSTSIHLESTCYFWSEWRDSNSRPPAPKAGALPTAQHPVILNTLVLYLFLSDSSIPAAQKTGVSLESA